MVDGRAETIGVHGDAGKLDRVSWRLFGKGYRRLSDSEAGKVWDDIEASEGSGQ